MLGNWSDGAATPVGRDKLDVVTRLVADEQKTVTFRAEFRPPAADRPPTRVPVDDAVGFREGSQQFPAGEDRRQGSNELSLMLRLGCSSTWEERTAQMPYTISRMVELSLLPAE